MEVSVQISQKVFNQYYLPYLNNESRYLILYGGAGSGKSYFAAERYVYKMLNEKNFNLLVVRATGKSNRDSTFALFKQIIYKWKLKKYFKINEAEMRIVCTVNQHEIVFNGLDDVEKLKSITFMSGELTDIWIEEASETQEADFKQLDLRLRGRTGRYQFMISFNPIDINHWLKKRFFDRKDENVTIVHSNYQNNDFIDEKYKELLESYKETDPYYYDVYCLGKWGVLGKTIFDGKAINQRLTEIGEPIRTGYFDYTDNGLTLSGVRWRSDPNGSIKLYKLPNKGQKFAIGGDTSGEGSDYFVGQVINAETGEQVAVLRHRTDPDLYARQMYCLGVYYNTALIGIESNFDSYPIKELLRLGYRNQFVREREDTFGNATDKSYGFRTTQVTRPVIISELVRLVREETNIFNDKDTLEEMMSFVRNDRGKAEAAPGAHDDLVMAIAIAHRIRDQIFFTSEPIIMEMQFAFDSLKPPTQEDWGDKLLPV